MSREPVAPRPSDDVRELRLALVCHGGVSLAIYMHGVTKEIHKLVRASTAFEHDPTHNPVRRPRDRARLLGRTGNRRARKPARRCNTTTSLHPARTTG